METLPAQAPEEPKLLVRLRNKIRLKHYSIRTEQAYVDGLDTREGRVAELPENQN